jgi:hypothetical protein
MGVTEHGEQRGVTVAVAVLLYTAMSLQSHDASCMHDVGVQNTPVPSSARSQAPKTYSKCQHPHSHVPVHHKYIRASTFSQKFTGHGKDVQASICIATRCILVH